MTDFVPNKQQFTCYMTHTYLNSSICSQKSLQYRLYKVYFVQRCWLSLFVSFSDPSHLILYNSVVSHPFFVMLVCDFFFLSVTLCFPLKDTVGILIQQWTISKATVLQPINRSRLEVQLMYWSNQRAQFNNTLIYG